MFVRRNWALDHHVLMAANIENALPPIHSRRQQSASAGVGGAGVGGDCALRVRGWWPDHHALVMASYLGCVERGSVCIPKVLVRIEFAF